MQRLEGNQNLFSMAGIIIVLTAVLGSCTMIINKKCVLETLSVVAKENVFLNEQVFAQITCETVLRGACLSMAHSSEVLMGSY
jgi:hypothetical protein